MLTGKFWPAAPNLCLSYADLDDVAAAHTLALVTPSASGRYIVSAESAPMVPFIREALLPRFKAYWLPAVPAPRWLLWIVVVCLKLFPGDMLAASLDKPVRFSAARAERELGLVLHSPKKALADACERVLELGLVPRRG